MMHQLMQNNPLRVGRILDHAARFHPNRPILTRSAEGPITRTNWAEIHLRARKVAQALTRMGVGRDAVVGAMAWNSARHLEIWYGVPGAGAALHTLNPRLFAEQLVYIINHAEDRVIMVDPDLVPVLEGIQAQLPGVTHYIVLTDAAGMPRTSLPGAVAYETWIADCDGDIDWAEVDETDACGICYTSGTTGNPKGVVYTHRSNTLHALTAVAPDMLGVSSNDIVMPVVPLFHANGWSIAYSAPIVGAGMVLPGRDLSPASLHELLEMGVTVTAAVPTIWLMLLDYMDREAKQLTSLKRVAIGGSSCPRAVIEAFQKRYGVQVLHAWGMTEMSPLGTVCSFKPEVLEMSPEHRLNVQETTGHPPFSVDLKITDDEGTILPWDNTAQGRLWVRGDCVVSRYFKADAPATDPEGWFDTGDVAAVDPNGYVRITDRSKDVIKSGGEWISSIDLENAALDHPDVLEAAAVGVPHPKWDERPVLVVVRRPDTDPAPKDILDVVSRRFARWQVPDDVVFMDALPHTATGKISKLNLRKKLQDSGYTLPG